MMKTLGVRRSRAHGARFIVLALVLIVGCGSSTTSTTPAPSSSSSPSGSPAPASPDLPPPPAPMPMPDGDPEQVASVLAAALRADDSLPAILSAFMASGIAVVDDSGAPLSGSPGGIPVTASETFVLSSLHATERGGMLLSDLGDMLSAMDPALTGAPIAQLLLDDLKTAAQSADVSVKTWANVLAELGRQRDGLDPLSATDPTAVVLDGMQLQLVLRRLAKDLVSHSSPSAERSAITLAAAHPGAGVTRPAAAAKAPCTFGDREGLIVTVAEEAISNGVGKVIEYLDDHGVAGVGKYARAAEIAQAVADVAQFLLAYLLLEVKVELVIPSPAPHGPPLIRTHEKRPRTGESGELQATVTYDIGNAQAINCLRVGFATLGMTFSVPQNEPLKDTPVSWTGVKGFDARTDRIVQFRGDPYHARTDQSGVARIGVEGFGQERKLSEDADPVDKSATVYVLVQLKDSNLGQDLWDAIDTGKETLSGIGAVTLPLKLMLETLYRTKLLAPEVYTFGVTDWECSAGPGPIGLVHPDQAWDTNVGSAAAAICSQGWVGEVTRTDDITGDAVAALGMSRHATWKATGVRFTEVPAAVLDGQPIYAPDQRYYEASSGTVVYHQEDVTVDGCRSTWDGSASMPADNDTLGSPALVVDFTDPDNPTYIGQAVVRMEIMLVHWPCGNAPRSEEKFTEKVVWFEVDYDDLPVTTEDDQWVIAGTVSDGGGGSVETQTWRFTSYK